MRDNGKQSKVLLVDDDRSVLRALTDVLEGEGYAVVQTYDAFNAVQQFIAHHDIELVLLDLNLPDRSGWVAFESFTLLRRIVPVIVITARPNQYEIANAAGAAALMEKPLDLPLLLETMAEVLAEPAGKRLARLTAHKPLTRYLTWTN